MTFDDDSISQDIAGLIKRIKRLENEDKQLRGEIVQLRHRVTMLEEHRGTRKSI